MLSHQALCRCSRSRSGWNERTTAKTLFWNVESGLRQLRSSSARWATCVLGAFNAADSTWQNGTRKVQHVKLYTASHRVAHLRGRLPENKAWGCWPTCGAWMPCLSLILHIACKLKPQPTRTLPATA